nr:MAG TPA: hypothetical protein [Caudoviricetes sp.]
MMLIIIGLKWTKEHVHFFLTTWKSSSNTDYPATTGLKKWAVGVFHK